MSEQTCDSLDIVQLYASLTKETLHVHECTDAATRLTHTATHVKSPVKDAPIIANVQGVSLSSTATQFYDGQQHDVPLQHWQQPQMLLTLKQIAATLSVCIDFSVR